MQFIAAAGQLITQNAGRRGLSSFASQWPFGHDAGWGAISGMPSLAGFHRHEPGVFSSIELPETRPLRPFLLAYLTPGSPAVQPDLDPAKRDANLLPRRTRLKPARDFLAIAKKLVPAPPSIAFRPFGCGPVARRSPIAIKAAVVAT